MDTLIFGLWPPGPGGNKVSLFEAPLVCAVLLWRPQDTDQPWPLRIRGPLPKTPIHSFIHGVLEGPCSGILRHGVQVAVEVKVDILERGDG